MYIFERTISEHMYNLSWTRIVFLKEYDAVTTYLGPISKDFYTFRIWRYQSYPWGRCFHCSVVHHHLLHRRHRRRCRHRPLLQSIRLSCKDLHCSNQKKNIRYNLVHVDSGIYESVQSMMMPFHQNLPVVLTTVTAITIVSFITVVIAAAVVSITNVLAIDHFSGKTPCILQLRQCHV